MALIQFVLLLLATSVCFSAPWGPLQLIKRKSKIKRSSPSRPARSCLMTCLEGESSQICFDDGIHDPRPGPVLPEYVCKLTGCLTSSAPCPTKGTTFPFQCMKESRYQWKQADDNDITSVCNVPVRRMEFCLFSPTSGSASVFSHGQNVTFEVQRKNSPGFKSKTCVCYDGQWIARNAVYGTKAVKKRRILCDVTNRSKKLRYLRVTNVMEPEFSKRGVFLKRFSERSSLFRQ